MDSCACPFRVDVRRQDAQESAKCLLLARSFESSEERLVRVQHDICHACCTDALHTPARINRVVASLIYTRAHQELVEARTDVDAAKLRVSRTKSGSVCTTSRPQSTELEMRWV